MASKQGTNRETYRVTYRVNFLHNQVNIRIAKTVINIDNALIFVEKGNSQNNELLDGNNKQQEFNGRLKRRN
jgi:hypothetical protein